MAASTWGLHELALARGPLFEQFVAGRMPPGQEEVRITLGVAHHGVQGVRVDVGTHTRHFQIKRMRLVHHHQQGRFAALTLPSNLPFAGAWRTLQGGALPLRCFAPAPGKEGAQANASFFCLALGRLHLGHGFPADRGRHQFAHCLQCRCRGVQSAQALTLRRDAQRFGKRRRLAEALGRDQRGVAGRFLPVLQGPQDVRLNRLQFFIAPSQKGRHSAWAGLEGVFGWMFPILG